MSRAMLIESASVAGTETEWWEATPRNSFTRLTPEDFLPLIAPEETALQRDVELSAVFLDEHLPDWHERVTKDVRMQSAYDCILGQIFRAEDGMWDPQSGYVRGMKFLRSRQWAERPFVFSSPNAAPHWDREIARRRAA